MKLNDGDSELYKNFNITISERWQNEIAETVFDVVNQDADKAEQKKRAKLKMRIAVDEKGEGGRGALAWQLANWQVKRIFTFTDTLKNWAAPSPRPGRPNMESSTPAASSCTRNR